MKELGFGTSGLRDTVENMTDMECYVNAKGFIAYLAGAGEFKKGDSIALGGDRRPSTYRIKRAVASAIRDMGGKVDDQGQVPSPALVCYAMHGGIASIMVTGSHIPADRNGIKFTKRSGEVLKSDEPGILESVRSQRAKAFSASEKERIFDERGTFKKEAASKAGELLKPESYTGEARELYLRRYADVFGKGFFPKGTRIFLYQHSAVGRDVVKEIFESLGAEVLAPDIEVCGERLRSGGFVPIDTESVSERTLSVFRKVLADNDIDIGITLDGDSDRPLLVYRSRGSTGSPHGEAVGSPTGDAEYVSGDILGLLAVLGLQDLGVKVDAVCVPVSANDSIAMVCKERGIELMQTRIGSPFVIAAMNDYIARHPGRNVFSWESNGGFLTGTDIRIAGKVLRALPTRDAALPLLSVIHLIAKSGKGVSALMKALPSRFTYADSKKGFPEETGRAVIGCLTPKRRGDPAESAAIKKRIEGVFPGGYGFGKVSDVDYTDGVRIFFDNREIVHLRPSGNAPEFRVYAIADSPARAREMVRFGMEKAIPALLDRDPA